MESDRLYVPLFPTFYCTSIDGEQGTGYLSVDDFLQVLMSRDLGLQLEENEQLYIASQVYYTYMDKN